MYYHMCSVASNDILCTIWSKCKGYNCPAHLSHSAGCMRPTLQGLTWFECYELAKEELLTFRHRASYI
jgi:hypothetical protein